jgi:uncharacterized damage-inducible protein DinB
MKCVKHKMLPEVAQYFDSIERQRTRIFQTLEQASSDAWNWTPTNDETNSLFVMATHVIGSEHGWIYEVLHDGPKTRNRPAEFLAKGNSLEPLRAEFQRVAEQTRQVLEGLTEADLASTRHRASHGNVTVRWILLHVIEHSSEHVGQMELTKQLWERRG